MKKIEEQLDPGTHTVSVEPVPEFSDEGRPIQGTHKVGKVKSGKSAGNPFWCYSTKINDERYYLNAWTLEEKNWYDTGEITLEIKTQFDKNSGQPTRRLRVLPPEYAQMTTKTPVRDLPVPTRPRAAINEPESVIRGQIATHLVAAFVSKEGLRELKPSERNELIRLIDLCLHPDQPVAPAGHTPRFSDDPGPPPPDDYSHIPF